MEVEDSWFRVPKSGISYRGNNRSPFSIDSKMLCDFSGSRGLRATLRKRPSQPGPLHPSPHTFREHGVTMSVSSVLTRHPHPKPGHSRDHPEAALQGKVRLKIQSHVSLGGSLLFFQRKLSCIKRKLNKTSLSHTVPQAMRC